MKTFILKLFYSLFILFFVLITIKLSRAGTQANQDMSGVRASIARILTEGIEIRDEKNNVKAFPQKTKVFDDRIEYIVKKDAYVIDFMDFLSNDIPTPTFSGSKIVIWAGKYGFFSPYTKVNMAKMNELRQNLVTLQEQLKRKNSESELKLFETTAAKYRAMKEKPQVSEEQRKFIVQANLFNQQKNYAKAIELYNKANEVDQIAYPAAYLNLALLYAQINNFNSAILSMKKYLLLEPESSDARSAQDKIYEWEAMITNH